MARPPKKGLDYSPQDVDIHSDRKIRRLLNEFGASGYLVYDYIKCQCFKENGYWVKYDDGFCFDVADVLKSGITENSALEILKGCFRMSLFDTGVFKAFRIITSKGIQERYLKAKKGAEVEEKYSCVNNSLIITDEMPPNDDLSPKEKERKEKEIKEKEKEREIMGALVADWNLFAEKFSKAKVQDVTDKRKSKIQKRLTEKNFDLQKILTCAAQSDFITGLDGSWFTFDWIMESESNYIKVLEGNYSNGKGTTNNRQQQNGIADYKQELARKMGYPPGQG